MPLAAILIYAVAAAAQWQGHGSRARHAALDAAVGRARVGAEREAQLAERHRREPRLVPPVAPVAPEVPLPVAPNPNRNPNPNPNSSPNPNPNPKVYYYM